LVAGLIKITYRSPRGAYAAWLFVVWFVFHGVSAQAETHDCGEWTAGTATFEYSGVRLGSLLSTLPYAQTPSVPSSGPRFFDGLEVDAYLVEARSAGRPNFVVETILCNNTERLIVGIINGELVPTQTAFERWASNQVADLRRDGVNDTRQERRGNNRYVWGIKTRGANTTSSGVGGYLLLRRRCLAAPESDLCGATGWQVHRALAKINAVQ
jgi:hypothetical protein